MRLIKLSTLCIAFALLVAPSSSWAAGAKDVVSRLKGKRLNGNLKLLQRSKHTLALVSTEGRRSKTLAQIKLTGRLFGNFGAKEVEVSGVQQVKDYGAVKVALLKVLNDKALKGVKRISFAAPSDIVAIAKNLEPGGRYRDTHHILFQHFVGDTAMKSKPIRAWSEFVAGIAKDHFAKSGISAEVDWRGRAYSGRAARKTFARPQKSGWLELDGVAVSTP